MPLFVAPRIMKIESIFKIKNAKRAHSTQLAAELASEYKQKPDTLPLEDFQQIAAGNLKYNLVSYKRS